MINSLQYIKMEALGTPVGQSKTVYCCFCDNDPPYAPSLSLTRIEEGILYNCFRACCSGQGMIGSLPANFGDKGKAQGFTPRPYTKPSMIADPENLKDLWHLTTHEVKNNGIRRTFGEDGYIFPLFDSFGNNFGHTTKLFKDKEQSELGYKYTKAQHYLTKETCNLHYAYNTSPINNGWVILVEDVISAIRVSRFRQGVALLGTHLNDKKVQNLLAWGAKNVVIALDPDALGKAIAIKKKYGIFFDTFRVVSLTNDPKDLTHEQLQKELEL